jgi:hypothetical protein
MLPTKFPVSNYSDLSDLIFHPTAMLFSDDYHLPEDDNHHSHRCGNLKSYMLFSVFLKD